mgnify:CR=1 FL=1
MKEEFSKILLKWFAGHHRPMPWKGVKNPYWIWLSEIILQQTRVEQGLPYYERFVKNYPKIENLANAKEDEVMKHWQGLGYYSRARNLHATAKYITNDLNGIFPKTHKEILNLKGVGPYTAAAIASFAYNLPHAVVDGNVYRVLSRIFGIKTPIDSTAGKKEFAKLADILINKKRASDYNQAIMDFGATQCTPKLPNCKTCPFQKKCVSFQNNWVGELPIKTKKIKKKERYFNYLLINSADKTLLHKRTEKDIWQNLYEFPLIETLQPFDLKEVKKQPLWKTLFPNENIYIIIKISPPAKQILTHRKIIATFIEISITQIPEKQPFLVIEKKDLKQYAFPKVITSFLADKSLYLELF